MELTRGSVKSDPISTTAICTRELKVVLDARSPIHLPLAVAALDPGARGGGGGTSNRGGNDGEDGGVMVAKAMNEFESSQNCTRFKRDRSPRRYSSVYKVACKAPSSMADAEPSTRFYWCFSVRLDLSEVCLTMLRSSFAMR
jgi:hypothetical protein